MLANLLSVENLARAANRRRQKSRPQEPKNLDFVLDEEFIQNNFLRADLLVGRKRHLVFATDKQHTLLKKAKTWYCDATFKIIKKPFTQLFSIHAFLKKSGEIKQVPLVCALMKRQRDYKKVFKVVKEMLPDARVKKMVADFESSIWQGFLSVYSNSDVQGCVFHWTQAIWRKMRARPSEAIQSQEATASIL